MTATRLLLGPALLLLAAWPSERAAPAAADRPAPVTGVRVEAVAPVSVRDTVDAVGAVRTKTQMLIASKMQGYVREVRARQGDHVEAGALLVSIDEREVSARVDRARAALSEARLGLDEAQKTLEEAAAALRSAQADHTYAEHAAGRYRELLARGLISAHEYDAVEAKRQSTSAAVSQAEARIRSMTAREGQMRHRIEQARAEERTAEIALGETRVTAGGALIPLAELVRAEGTTQPPFVYRKNLQRVVYVTGDVAGQEWRAPCTRSSA
jgi:multidrug efflux pump subunit AcrA (membrane-fusion protein)